MVVMARISSAVAMSSHGWHKKSQIALCELLKLRLDSVDRGEDRVWVIARIVRVK